MQLITFDQISLHYIRLDYKETTLRTVCCHNRLTCLSKVLQGSSAQRRKIISFFSESVCSTSRRLKSKSLNTFLSSCSYLYIFLLHVSNMIVWRLHQSHMVWAQCNIMQNIYVYFNFVYFVFCVFCIFKIVFVFCIFTSQLRLYGGSRIGPWGLL